MSSKTEHFYYLDTSYLITYLSFKHEPIAKKMSIKSDAHITANSVIKSISQKIRIPIIVVSEAVRQLMEHEVPIGVVEIFGGLEVAYLKRELLADFSSILRDLVERDERLEPIDCMIAAFSIASPECCGLLTFDRELVENKVIKDIIRERYPSREFLVTSDPRRS